MSNRVVVFLDYQNVYKGARAAFHSNADPHWNGQIDPFKLGQFITNDSKFDRELHQVRVYRGQPDATRDRKGYGACSRQVAIWRQNPKVDVTVRTLRYPTGWPNTSLPGEKPQEKGIDVALALDFLAMAIRGEYDTGVLMSTDTDLKPALEQVARLTAAQGNLWASVAAWSAEGEHNRRLSIKDRALWCHWLDRSAYTQVADSTDYSHGL